MISQYWASARRETMVRARVAALVVLLSGLMMSACSRPEPIALGSAPASPSSRIVLPLLSDRPGIYPVNMWPKACDLLSDADLRAVFPQAADVTRKPEDLRLSVFTDPLRGGGGRYVVPGAQCTYRFSLPGAQNTPGETWGGYVLKLDVYAVGNREFVRENRHRAGAGQTRVIGGAECTVDVDSVLLSCAADRMGFTLQDLKGNVTQDGGVAHFQRNGQVTTFDGDRLTQIDQQHDFVTRYVLPEVVKTIVAKL
ncbi:hypothetical protein [Pseudonocardia spinosispora]|uniref:hypothetical protein n=1 Tax=Pseudonocardia spinosispora TaxID=103441 RepID=UPI00048B4362|nr:hypothetical protein [Pseudonocardia spinosispora]